MVFVSAFCNMLHSTHCSGFHYMKLYRPAYFVRTTQLLPHLGHVVAGFAFYVICHSDTTIDSNFLMSDGIQGVFLIPRYMVNMVNHVRYSLRRNNNYLFFKHTSRDFLTLYISENIFFVWFRCWRFEPKIWNLSEVGPSNLAVVSQLFIKGILYYMMNRWWITGKRLSSWMNRTPKPIPDPSLILQ